MWEDIDRAKGVIHVKRAVTIDVNQPVISETKTAAGVRDFGLCEALESILFDGEEKESGFIIGDGEKPLSKTMYTKTMMRIKKTIDLHGATAHKFRHTLPTQLSEHLDPKALQIMMGHSDISTTMNIYTHARMNIPSQTSAAINTVFKDIKTA